MVPELYRATQHRDGALRRDLSAALEGEFFTRWLRLLHAWLARAKPEDLPGITFVELFDYAPVFVAASTHPLAQKKFIDATDFLDQTLITYPVERTRLDVFSQLLIPAKVEPRAVRQAELTAVILLLVASNRGVSVLPDWVVREVKYSSDYVTRPLTRGGLKRSLYAAVRTEECDKPYMQKLIALARIEARKLQTA